MNRFAKYLGIFILLSLSNILYGQVLNHNIGFEDGTITGWRNNNDGDPTSYTEVVSSPHQVRAGAHALLLEVQSNDRNEIIMDEDIQFYDGNEYWLGQSIYLQNFTRDYLAWTTLMQMHTVPGNFNWNCNTPPNTWTLYTGHPDGDANPDHLTIGFAVWHDSFGSFDPYTVPPTSAAIGRDAAWEGLVSDYENRWVDIVVNWIPSSNNDGFIKCWIDGELVVDLQGPNLFYYDRCGVPREPYTYFQTGIYKEQSQSNIKREIYIDEIRIGGANSSYNDVVPRGEPLNTPPVLASIGNQSVNEESSITISLNASDIDGDPISYTISPNIEFVTLTDNQNGTGTIRVAPGVGNAGTYYLTVTVTDSKGDIDSETISVIVNEAPVSNNPPVLAQIGNRSVTEEMVLNVSLSSTDADGDSRSFSISPSLSFVSLTDHLDGTGTLNIAPNSGDAGTYSLTITVTDSKNGNDSETIDLLVYEAPPSNSAPVLAQIGNKSVTEGLTINVSLSSTDADGDMRNFTISPSLSFVSLTDNQNGTGNVRISPDAGDAGTYTTTITVTDSEGASDSETFSILIYEAGESNSPPVLGQIRNKSVTEGLVLNVSLSSSDADGDKRNFSIVPNLNFVTLTDNQNGTGNLRIAPKPGDANTYSATITVTDQNNATDSETFLILVYKADPENQGSEGNTIPLLTRISDQLVSVGQSLEIALTASDADGDLMEFSISPNLNFISLIDNGNGTGLLRVSPNQADIGKYNLTVNVSDSKNGKSSRSFNLIVNDNSNARYTDVINSGGTSISYGSMLAQEDKYFTGGKTSIYGDNYNFEKTEEDNLYRAFRYGNFSYEIPVPLNGLYTVRLHFAEINHQISSIGQRIFNVNIEDGQQHLVNFDILMEAEPFTAVVKTFTGVQVTDNYLSIDLNTVVRNAIISGIEIISETDQVTELELEDIAKDIIIYPNPSDGYFTIDISANNPSLQDVPLLIYDVAGKIVYQSTLNGNKSFIDISDKQKGFYILRLGELKTEKILLH